MRIHTFFKDLEPGPLLNGTQFVSSDGKRFHLICSCGNTFSIAGENRLSHDGNFMCRGCYERRDAEQFDPEWGYKSVLKRIRNDARRAGREFNLSLDWFKKISQSECHYCGSEPRNEFIYNSNAGKYKRTFLYNGLDRMSNEIGYVEWNCVPCCFVCNRAKNSMPYDLFIEWIDKVVAHRSVQFV